jgi:uncharacterized protein (UPF0261 family)
MTADAGRKSIYAIATMDTKGEELQFVASCLRAAGAAVRCVDVGTKGPPVGKPDVTRQDVLGAQELTIAGHDRGQAVTSMGEALRAFLLEECRQGRVAGVLGIGGSGGTALITAAMRALPIGLPKLMVSTVASGNTAPYVDCCDITMMYSVVDVAGLNAVSRRVLANAAHAMAGMTRWPLDESQPKPTVGLTMFGVTTPCVTMLRQALEQQGSDCLVFHATGTGGRAMERLVESGLIQGVLDITTTEVADEVVGGVFACGPERFERILESGVPYVVSLGALDMVNFGAVETVPPQFRDRLLHVHNAQVTLMRTTAEENRQFARWIAGKLNRSSSPVTLIIPERGVSALDAPGQPFHDPQADAALFETLEAELQQTDQRRLLRLSAHINDPKFADQALGEYHRLVEHAAAPNGRKVFS